MKNKEEPGVHVWVVMMKAYRAMEEYALHSIANTGICFSDFAVLEALLHKGPLPVNTIGSKVRLTSGSITTAVDRLEKRGLVRRENDPEDRRSRIVHLTSEGRELIEQLFALHRRDMEEAVSNLSASERTALIGLLKKLGKTAAYRQLTLTK